MGKGVAGYDLMCGGQEVTLHTFKFTGANGANPTALTQPTGKAYVSGVTRDGEGSYVAALRDDWFAIYPVACEVMTTTEGEHAKVDAVSTTTGANTVSITAFAGGAADDLDAKVVVVTVLLCRR